MSPTTTNSVSGHSLLQWNCQGIRNKKEEIIQYIDSFKIDILTVQETMLDTNQNFNLPNYNIERCDGHFNRRAHGGVATFIHSSLPYERIQLNT